MLLTERKLTSLGISYAIFLSKSTIPSTYNSLQLPCVASIFVVVTVDQ